MARYRRIKPSYWVSEQVINCSPLARLLFIGIWNFNDDKGIHKASYTTLKAEIFPGDNLSIDDIKHCINELIAQNLLREYAVNGQLYWLTTGWHHQTIDKPSPSDYPLPESELKQITDESMNDQRTLADYSPNSLKTIDDNSSGIRRVLDESSMSPRPLSKVKKRKEEDQETCEVETSPRCVSKLSNASTIKPLSDELIVFEYWQRVMDHPKAKLDSKRLKKIEQAFKLGYSLDDLKKAIDGLARTPFNVGANDAGQRYDDIELILRDASHIEKFIANATGLSLSTSCSASANDLSVGAI